MDFTLTRYLYSKTEVYQSLFISLLECQPEESLYWAYENYFSGFEEEVVEYLRKIYTEIYAKENPKLSKFIETTIEQWYKTPTQHHLIGSLVYTLAIRKYNLDEFVTNYFNTVCLPQEMKPATKRRLIVYMEPEQIEPYYTIIDDKPRKILQVAVKYRVRKYVNQLFKATEQPNEIYETPNRWLYFAANSPIWQKRIEEHGGKTNDETKTVYFESDDVADEFYGKWDYDFDEQPAEIKRYICGEQPQINLKEFALRYGVNIIVKKNIKISSITKPENLQNSITYHP